jgi:hypothetical protein
VLGVFALTLVAGVVLLIRDLGRLESEKQGRGHVTLLLGCLGLPAAWIVAYVAIAAYLALTFRENRMYGNEASAIGSLKTLGSAQALFREADGDDDGNYDYGTLSELAAQTKESSYGLIDPILGSGTERGYLFTCTYSPTTSEFLWFATARPAIPGTSGERYFATNHEGVLYYTTSQPFAIDPATCEIPDSAMVVGGSGTRGQLRAQELRRQKAKSAPPGDAGSGR